MLAFTRQRPQVRTNHAPSTNPHEFVDHPAPGLASSSPVQKVCLRSWGADGVEVTPTGGRCTTFRQMVAKSL